MGYWDETALPFFNKHQDSIEAGASAVAANIPGVSTAVSAMSGAYHTTAGIYCGMTGDRDGAVSHGAQAVTNGLSLIPGVDTALQIADNSIASAGVPARIAAEQGKLGKTKPGDIPTSSADWAAAQAVQATNAIFGKDDSNWFADGTTPQGTRQGEINAGAGGIAKLGLHALGPAGTIADMLGADEAIGDAAGNFIGDMFGSSKQPGTTAGAGGDSYWQKSGQDMHELAKKAVQGGRIDGNPTPLVPKAATPGSGSGSGPGGSASSKGTGPGSGGSPGRPLGPADGQLGPSSGGGGMQLPPNLRGPGGLIEPTVTPAGPADAQGQLTPEAPMPYGIQPKLSPQGPMPYGIQPKGNNAPMSGPMPKMPWFLEPAGPSTW